MSDPGDPSTAAGRVESLASSPDSHLDFDQLHRRHYRRVVGYFRRRHVPPYEAEELAQETFLNAFRGRQDFRGEAQELTWLLVIAKNLFANHVRALKTHKRDAPEVSIDDSPEALDRTVPEVTENAPTALDDALNEEKSAILRDAIGELPQRIRQIMRMAFVHGLKYREIAKTLGIAENTVKSSVYQGKAKLKEYIREHAPEWGPSWDPRWLPPSGTESGDDHDP